MAMNINTNIPSLNAQRNLTRSQSMLNNSLQRLSSGLRINSAKDDAAGLAISNRMTSQIRGLDQAVRNANDGISLAQTAEGALQESGNILQRIRELAVQASSDGSTDADRASMQVEVDQLVSELDRIATTTSFNGKVLLDGSFGTGNFQVGANAGQTVSMTMTSARTNALGASTTSNDVGNYTMAKETSTAGSLVTSGDMATLSAGNLTINGTEIRAAQSGDDTVSTSDNAGSSLAIAAAINASSDKTGVTAYAEKTTVALGSFGAEDTGIAADEFQINGIDVTGSIADEDDLAAAINALSDQTGVTASVSGGDVTLTAVDGRNIQITADGNATLNMENFNATGALDQTQRGTVSLYSNSSFTIGGTSPTTAGMNAGTVSLDEKHWTTENGTSTFDDLAAGDLVINGYSIIAPTVGTTDDGDISGDTKSSIDGAASAKAIAYAINNTDGLKNEVYATAKTVANLGTVSSETSGTLTLKINGMTSAIAFDEDIVANDANGYVVGKLNATFAAATEGDAEYGLVASMNSDNELIITSDTGVNIDVEITAASSSSVFSAIDTSIVNDHFVHKGTISLEAKTGYTLESVEGGKKALAGIETAVGTIENVDISTYSGAQNAITAVDGALAQIDDQRAELGAIQNRFDSTIANLSTTSENLSAAKARIMDADFAMETANMTKAQILQQAGTAMLAQANQLPQQVLSLLQ